MLTLSKILKLRYDFLIGDLFYLTVASICIFIIFYFNLNYKIAPESWYQIGEAILLGIATTIVVWWLSYIPIFKSIEGEFKEILVGSSIIDYFLLSLSSAVGEELFFRGLIQYRYGILISSCLFACVHIPTKPTLIGWPLFALLMGLWLGFIFKIKLNISYPIIIHFIVNFIGMIRIGKV